MDVLFRPTFVKSTFYKSQHVCYIFSYYVLNSHLFRGPKMTESNIFVGDASSDFHIHFSTITARFGRFLFKGPEQNIQNGET